MHIAFFFFPELYLYLERILFDLSALNTKLYGKISTEEFVVLKPEVSGVKPFWVSNCSHKDILHNMTLV